MIQIVAGEREAGERVDVVLARRAGVTRTAAQRALRAGEVTVSGAPVRPSHRLSAGESIEGQVTEPEGGPPEAEDIPVSVRFEDERLMVVAKPAGLVTHPARGHTSGTLVNALLALEVPLARAGSTRPGIVHRLDKDTSGLLLVAKDDGAQDALVAALRERRITRRYLALVRGKPAAARGTIQAPVGRHPTRRWSMSVTSQGRPSVTHYEVDAANEGVALLEVALETGRTHQIRVHLAHLGHPVVGDRIYGGGGDLARSLKLDRPWLHAGLLAFPHPDDGRTVEVVEPPPSELQEVLVRVGIALGDAWRHPAVVDRAEG